MVRLETVTPETKEGRLIEFLRQYSDVIVAFSGGVDSSYLAFMAHRVLGRNARSVTAISPSVSNLQREVALGFASTYEINHKVISTQEMENPDYASNPSNRCYFCKSELYVHLERLAKEWGVEAIFDGSNKDDVGDYRPGRKASREFSVISPFIEVGLTKDEIRQQSRKWGLPSWDQPAMPCLSSRFPYGVAITEQSLRQVDDAEAFLRGLGLRNFRVRHHDNLARIEVDLSEQDKILDRERFASINQRLRDLGYQYVTLDLQGFRSGSLNVGVQLDVESKPPTPGTT